MRLKPVGGSIRGRISDGYTATASNNEISPKVEHVCVCVCVCASVCMCRESRRDRREKGKRKKDKERKHRDGWEGNTETATSEMKEKIDERGDSRREQ